MSLFALVASFGGGAIDAYIGTPPAFMLTGVIATAGVVAVMARGADMTVGFTTFGSYLGPHITFASGVVVSAYADKTKELGSGAGILSCLNGLADLATLLVDGVFDVTGSLVYYVIGAILYLNTDLPRFTVIIFAVIVRLVLGSSDLTGKTAPDKTREYFTGGKGMLYNVTFGSGIGATIGSVYQALVDGGASVVSIGGYPVLCSGIAAVSLILAQIGLAMPAAHHIVLILVLVAIITQNSIMGIIFDILTPLFGDSISKIFSNCCDIHIDPPAFTIFIFTFIVSVLFGGEFFGA